MEEEEDGRGGRWRGKGKREIIVREGEGMGNREGGVDVRGVR